jgi:succinate dehydrogenase/fumarate reductase flavoprotein subunit
MTEARRSARRDFLKKSAAAAASLATAGMFAEARATPVDARGGTLETDVVIVGSGIAGISAAIEAADAGAKVIVIEKDKQPGGCAKFSGGHMTVAGTYLQAKAGVEDNPDWLFEDMMADGEWVAVPELIRKYVDAGPEHIMWLERMGVRFAADFQADSNTDRVKEGAARGHMIAASPDYPGGPHEGGLGLMLMLMRAAKTRGIVPKLEHTMTQVTRANGRVTGVEVEAGGRTFEVRARKAVVMTSGGWSGNVRMAMAEDPRLTEDIYPDCWPYHLCLGEGHVAATSVGAELSNMAYGGYLVPRYGSRVYQIWEPPTFETVPSIHTGLPVPDFQHVMLIKSDGNRFVNEKLGDPKGVPLPGNPKFSYTPQSFPGHPFVEAYLNLPERPRNVWAVADREGASALGWTAHEDELRKPNPKAGHALYPEMVAVADTPAELARQMKVNAGGLAATIQRYNGFVAQGQDKDFGKPVLGRGTAKLPYFALRMALVKHTRRNGIRVNTRGQVLDRAGLLPADAFVEHGDGLDRQLIIPGFYAAGECASYLGRSHGHGTLGIYSYYGRIAGRNAALATT